jgi:ATP synthase protein I
MTTIKKPPLFKLFLYNHLAVIVLTAAALAWSAELALSVLCGGLVQSLPQSWFNYQAYRFTGASQLHNILRAMYWGQSGKIILSAALFVAVLIRVRPAEPLALFGAFCVMILVHSVLAARLTRAPTTLK